MIPWEMDNSKQQQEFSKFPICIYKIRTLHQLEDKNEGHEQDKEND